MYFQLEKVDFQPAMLVYQRVVSGYIVTPIYKIYKPFIPFGMGTAPVRGLTITMVTNHLLTGMILQVLCMSAYRTHMNQMSPVFDDF